MIWFGRNPVFKEIDLSISDWIKYPKDSIQSSFFEILSDWVYPRRQHDIGCLIVVSKTTIFSNPRRMDFSIPLASLKDFGDLARVDSGQALAYSGLFDTLTHAVSSFLPPVQIANSVGPSVA